MPAPNDLTPEEEAEFINHGVQPAGPGSEPINEGAEEQQPIDEQGQQANEQQAQHSDRPRRPDGTFKSAAEIAAEQQGQQEEGQQQEEGAEQKTVPLAALHAERQRVQTIARRLQLAETRMNAMLASRQPEPQGRQAMPKLEDDPAGYIVAMEQRLAAFEEANQADRETRQIDTALENDENLFSVTVPDYKEASNHYVQSRAQELLQFYPPEEAQQIMLNEARQISREAWQRGRSAAETIYALAQARGYTSGAAQPSSQGQQPKPNAQALVRGVKQAQGASRSLSGGRGPSAAALNAEALLNMSDEEFEEHLALGKKGADARFAAI